MLNGLCSRLVGNTSSRTASEIVKHNDDRKRRVALLTVICLSIRDTHHDASLLTTFERCVCFGTLRLPMDWVGHSRRLSRTPFSARNERLSHTPRPARYCRHIQRMATNPTLPQYFADINVRILGSAIRTAGNTETTDSLSPSDNDVHTPIRTTSYEWMHTQRGMKGSRNQANAKAYRGLRHTSTVDPTNLTCNTYRSVATERTRLARDNKKAWMRHQTPDKVEHHS